MTIQELKEFENKYIEEHKNDPINYYDQTYGEFMPYEVGDELDFLKQGLIKKFSPEGGKYPDSDYMYELNDEEILILHLFLANASKLFRKDSFKKLPDLNKELCNILESALNKLPKFDKQTVLYRFCHDYDKSDFEINDIFQPIYALTTTKDDWKQNPDTIYIITPLGHAQTNARCVYSFAKNSEAQVTFLENTKFKITKIEMIGNSKVIYMDEIK